MTDKVTRAVKGAIPNTAADVPETPATAPAIEAPSAEQTVVSVTPAAEYELEFPVTLEGEEITKVPFFHLKGRDFAKIRRLQSANDDDAELGMIAVITHLPIEVIGELRIEDFVEVAEIVEGFLPSKLLEKGAAASTNGPNTQRS